MPIIILKRIHASSSPHNIQYSIIGWSFDPKISFRGQWGHRTEDEEKELPSTCIACSALLRVWIACLHFLVRDLCIYS